MRQNESTDEEILEKETIKYLEVDDDEKDLVEDVLLGLQAIKEPPTKVHSEAEKMKWSSVFWSSSL